MFLICFLFVFFKFFEGLTVVSGGVERERKNAPSPPGAFSGGGTRLNAATKVSHANGEN